MGEGMLLGDPRCDQAVSCIDSTPTMLQKLMREKARGEERLSKVNAAIDALNKNPELASMLEIIRQAM